LQKSAYSFCSFVLNSILEGECFSGAWFSHSSHVIHAPGLTKLQTQANKVLYNFENSTAKRRRIPCEDGSFYFFHNSGKRKEENPWGEEPHQSIDLLDFSVLHLSAAERLLTRSPPLRKAAVKDVGGILKSLDSNFNSKQTTSLRLSSDISACISCSESASNVQNLLNSTLVMIPFLLKNAGQGGSRVTFRQKVLFMLC